MKTTCLTCKTEWYHAEETLEALMYVNVRKKNMTISDIIKQNFIASVECNCIVCKKSVRCEKVFLINLFVFYAILSPIIFVSLFI